MKNPLKVLLSLFIIYHLAVILLMPNGNSFVGRKYQNLFLNYSNAISLNTTWNFFSPDPAHTMYLKYTVFFENDLGEEIKEAVRGYYPEEKSQGTIHPAKRRDMYLMRYIMLDQRRLDYFILPWMCRHYEGATRVQADTIIEKIPLLDRVTEDNAPVIKEELKMQHYEKTCAELNAISEGLGENQ